MNIKTLRRILAVMALVLVLVSCGKKDRIIPRAKMSKIYAEMFLSDQWVLSHPESRSLADSSWIYEPIFNKYGYTTSDYRASVAYYLQDPERFARMFKRAANILDTREQEIKLELSRKDRMRQLGNELSHEGFEFENYKDLLDQPYVKDSIMIIKDTLRHIYKVTPIKPKTFYNGPEVIVDTTSEKAPDLHVMKVQEFVSGGFIR